MGTLIEVGCASRQASPIIVVEDDETTVAASEGDLVAVVVPPVGMRLPVDHVTEEDHVPKGRRNIGVKVQGHRESMCCYHLGADNKNQGGGFND